MLLDLKLKFKINKTIWKATNESLTCALDLVNFIHQEYQDYFHMWQIIHDAHDSLSYT